MDTIQSTNQTADSCTTKQQITCPTPTNVPAPAIINTILADVNAIVPNFSSLVSSYRLLVGSAEEIHRIPGVCPDVFERAVRRFDNAGTLIDILLDLLCCKIAYSSEFLRITCAPVDLFSLLSNRFNPCDQSFRTAEQIITLEALRRVLSDCLPGPCLPDNPVVCATGSPNSPPPTSTPPRAPLGYAVTFNTALRGQDESATYPESPLDFKANPNLDDQPAKLGRPQAHESFAKEKKRPGSGIVSPLRRRHI